MTQADWSDVLTEGEVVQWQGRPAPVPTWQNRRLYGQMGWSVVLLLMVATAFAVSPEARDAQPLSLVLLVAVLGFSFMRSWSAWFALRKTRYAITDTRILWRRGGQLREFDRDGATAEPFRDTLPPSLLIKRADARSPSDALAFEFIEDAQTVTDLIPGTRKANPV